MNNLLFFSRGSIKFGSLLLFGNKEWSELSIKEFISFGEKHPHLVCEWDLHKNEGLSPFEVSYGSNNKLWWKCEKGHEWQQSAYKRGRYGLTCHFCRKKLPSHTNNLLLVNPTLCEEWDYKKNILDPSKISPNTRKNAWWICKNCTHSWSASISNRNRERGCPRCRRNATSFPEQTIFYYFKKIFYDTENRFSYKRGNESFELDIFIPSLNIGIEYDGHYHQTKQEMDEKKNKFFYDNGIKLFRIRCENASSKLPKLDLFGSTSFIHYVPKGHSDLEDAIKHIFEYIVKTHNLNVSDDRYSLFKNLSIEKDKKEILNSYLTNLRKDNLTITRPHLISEWNYEKNIGLTPERFSQGSNVIVWWKCIKGHEWEGSIASRNKSNCPYCYGKRVCIDNCLATISYEISLEWHSSKNGDLTPFDLTSSSPVKVWWICSKGHEWIASVNNRFKNGKIGTCCPECAKTTKFGRLYERRSLSVTHKHLLIDWDFSKNVDFSINKLAGRSNVRVNWKCACCGHEWICAIATKKECIKCQSGKEVKN